MNSFLTAIKISLSRLFRTEIHLNSRKIFIFQTQTSDTIAEIHQHTAAPGKKASAIHDKSQYQDLCMALSEASEHKDSASTFPSSTRWPYQGPCKKESDYLKNKAPPDSGCYVVTIQNAVNILEI